MEGKGFHLSVNATISVLILIMWFTFPVRASSIGISQFQENGMGHVVLAPDKSLKAQLLTPNTIYEIRYTFDLGADSVVVPAGSVLYFIGGEVNNGILVGQNTKLFFVEGRLGCQLNGTFSNESIHVEWFGIRSGKEYAADNNRIMQTLVIPSMEKIGNTLYMNPQTEMCYSEPLVFNGTFDLDLRGRLSFSGPLVSTAVSIGTPDTRIYGKTYTIHSVVATNTTSFYNKGKVKENVGVCLWNLKHCNVIIDDIFNFSYCLRLCGNVGGCSSNTIRFTRIGGNCYYGIHCCSYDIGWVNENTFYCKAIINNSNNPAKDVMCAIWLDARGDNTCNSNVFFAPCVENCHHVVKFTNAIYNVIYDARAERVVKALISEGKSRNNFLYCKYWDRVSDYSSSGSNRVIKQSEIIPPFVQVFSEQIGATNTQHYGVCFEDGTLQTQGRVSGGVVFGRIVEIADPNKDINLEFVFEQPGRFCVVLLNDDYTFKSIKSLDGYLLSTNVSSTINKGFIWSSVDARRISLELSNRCGKMLVGTFSGSNYGDVIAMNVYSDNLVVDELYTVDRDGFKLTKEVSVGAFNYKSPSKHFLSDISTVELISALNLKGSIINLNNKVIRLGKNGRFVNGEIDVTGSVIFPSFNALIESADIVVRGMPGLGTMYFQRGRPTWSNGTAWVDASGRIVK